MVGPAGLISVMIITVLRRIHDRLPLNLLLLLIPLTLTQGRGGRHRGRRYIRVLVASYQSAALSFNGRAATLLRNCSGGHQAFSHWIYVWWLYA